MSSSIAGKKIAIIVTDGYEQSELEKPMEALGAHGAVCEIVSPKYGHIKGWSEKNWSRSIEVDAVLEEASEEAYDALFIPGGTLNCDTLRMDPHAVQLVGDFFEAGKPVGAICHGPQLLIEADVVDGRELTSYASIRTDLENAGARWVDKEVVVDRGLVTSRSPEDLAAFIEKLIEEIGASVHETRAAANAR